MNAVLREHLIIRTPGTWAPRLRALATFHRTGRLRPGERRPVRLYRWDPAAKTLALPRGLLPVVRQALPLQVRDERVRRPPVRWAFHGTPFDYQAAAVEAVVHQEGGVLVALPGAGKTAMACLAVATWQQPTLWVVHTLGLAQQARGAATRWLGLPPGQVGFVGDEQHHWRPFTVAMMQTLVRQPDLLAYAARAFGTVVLDEAHHAAAAGFSAVAAALPARYLLGLTATPDREDGLGPMVTALLGPRVVVPVRVLLARGRILLPGVRLVPTAFAGAPGANWAQLEKLRAEDDARNRLLLDQIWRCWHQRRRTLVLVERTRHAARLRRALETAGVPARVIIGDTPGPERDRAFADTEAGRVVGIATKLANEGIDIPAVDALILGAASRARTRTIQQVGRAMRTATGKADAWVVDLADVNAPAYADQVRDRLRHYREIGCRIRRERGPGRGR